MNDIKNVELVFFRSTSYGDDGKWFPETSCEVTDRVNGDDRSDLLSTMQCSEAHIDPTNPKARKWAHEILDQWLDVIRDSK